MISRYVNKYSLIITRFLSYRYIQFPRTAVEIAETKTKFDRQFNFPGIIGVIDGTHIDITAVPREIENSYVNRKGIHYYYSEM